MVFTALAGASKYYTKKETRLNDVQKMCSVLLQKVEEITKAVCDGDLKIRNIVSEQYSAFEKRILPRLKSTVEDVVSAEVSVLRDLVRRAGTDQMCVDDTETGNKVVKNTAAVATYASVTRSNLAPTRLEKRKAHPAVLEDDNDDCSILRSGKRRKMTTKKTSRNESSGELTAACETPVNTSKLQSLRPVSHVAKNSAVLKMEQTVLFKPKVVQLAEITRKDIREKLDPIVFDVKEVYYRENGEATIRCGSNELALKMAHDAKNKFSEVYVIENLKPLKPRFKIIGLSDEIPENEIIAKMKQQNHLPETADLKVIRVQKSKRTENTRVVVFESDPSTFYCLMKAQRVNIGWDRCRIFEVVDVMRCYRCSEYGHKAATCKNLVCCPKCAEEHPINECSSDFERCVNCQLFNSEQELDADKLDFIHPSWSSECPLYQKRLKKAKLRIDYST
ncbi:uncharacterized protein LOC131692909 [Topomyia yanbarensis]|uniref:uncharacterized protein LOC131692909 n=1 Tax=Topomyia yanbarensis TaxID=2498891 RepID=UPI00273C6431|nr:uncharacterized protein LOC131692909 [Topomyia yanbarensis]